MAPRHPARPALEPLDARVVPAGGTLDPAFGNNGIASLLGAPVTGIAVQPDGKIVAVGSTGGDFLVARFTAGGTLDPTFGSGGRRQFDVGGTDAARAVAVQADGKIVVAGSTATGGGSDMLVARLNTNGTDDSTFNGSGRRLIDLGGADSANAVALQPADGKIVLAGVGGADPDFAVVRIDPTNGALDGTFNGSGVRLVGFGGAGENDAANAVAVQTDGKIVAAGRAGSDIGVARLTTTGGLDGTFNGSGVRTLDAGGTTDSANGIALQPDDRIVLAGTNGSGIVAYRLLPATGGFDATFGSGGRVGLSPTGSGDAANAVSIQSDGKVVLAGGTGAGDVVVARLATNGTPDATFGSGGIATFNPDGTDAATSLALTTGDRIVAGGTADANGFLIQLLGTASTTTSLVVTGPGNGQAQLYAANPATGFFSPGPTIGPFSGLGFVTLRAASADVDGDGTADTVLVTGPGTPIRVAVVSGVDNSTLLVAPFDPFGGDFPGGGYVAAADMTGDGKAEFVVTPDQGGGPRVSVFSRNPAGSVIVRANFFGIDDPDFRGGARAALGDVNGDTVPDVVVAAGFGGGPRVAIFRGQSVLGGAPSRLVNDFFAFPGEDAVNLRNGAFVAAGDVTGDGKADLIFGGGPGGAPRVFILSGALVSAGQVDAAQASPVANFFVAGDANDRGGVRVAVTGTGGARPSVAVGSGEGSPARVRVYPGTAFPAAGEPGGFQNLTPFGGAFLSDGVYVG